MRKSLVALACALALALSVVCLAPVAHAGAIGHIIPSGCSPTGNVPCTFNIGSPSNEITVGPTSSGSGETAVEAVQASTEVYTESVDVMKEAKPGASKAWIAFRHHDSKDKYVLLLKNRAQLQFIVEKAGVNHTLATAPYTVGLNVDMDVEIDASGYTFSVYDLRAGRALLFTVTDSVGRISAGNGDSIDLYVNQGTQACWDNLTGRPE